MPLEIERKFLVRTLPEGFDELPFEEVRQGYAEDGLRFRQKGSRFFETRKVGMGTVAEEQEREITREEFERRWPSTAGRRLEKTRTRVALEDGLEAEVDIFKSRLAGLLYVEVEFPDVDSARQFTPPDWFGREVTDEPLYKNSSLARYGLPVDWSD